MTIDRVPYRGAEAWVVAAWSEGERVLRDPDFSAEPQRRADPYLLGADGPAHLAVRARYERALREVPIAPSELVGSALAELDERFERDGEAELYEHLATPLVARLVAAYLDVDRSAAHALARGARVAARIGAGELAVDRASAATLDELAATLTAALHRPAARRGDLPARLRALELPIEVVESLIRITVIGAVETTARLIAETAVQALRHDHRAPARAALAAAPPLRHVLRRSRRDVTLAGVAVPAGALVLVRLAGGPAGAAFGAGPHRCPGRAHALALAHEVARRWDRAPVRLVDASYGPGDLSTFGGPHAVRVARARPRGAP